MMSLARWDCFLFPDKKQFDHRLNSQVFALPSSDQMSSLSSFILTMGQQNMYVLHHTTVFQPVPVSIGQPRTAFSTNLKCSYTNLSLCYPGEHPPFYQTQGTQQWHQT